FAYTIVDGDNMKLIKSNLFKIPMAIIFAIALTQNAPASDKAYKRMAKELSKSALSSGIQNIAITPFKSESESYDTEPNYASDKLTKYLANEKKLNILERNQLESVLREIKATSIRNNQYNSAEKISKILPAEAIITGAIYEDFMATKVMVKLIDIKTGKILAAVDSEIEGQIKEPDLSKMDFTMPDLDAMNPPKFRDALNDFDAGENYCSVSQEELEKMQISTIESKAIYWALKLKNPNFSYSQLTQNPGSEIKNRSLRKKFYERLEYWHNQSSIPQLSSMEAASLDYVFKKEKYVKDNCRL
ncbi:MAG: CsgG/HfaB family protein, partial [Elusimicrobiota bacterium]|nr:CsgG/HfaB family protein [Elusimicrobiota bacterium]